MSTLFINAAFRDGSRTGRLARHYLETLSDEVIEVNLGDGSHRALDSHTLAGYLHGVGSHSYADDLFDAARQFAAADEIVIAAPYWNNSIPAALHDYLELVCSQGVTFDIMPDGSYVGLCRARRLVFLCTAGGTLPEHDHCWEYVESLARDFWHIPERRCYKAEDLDQAGCDVEAALSGAMARIDADREQARARAGDGVALTSGQRVDRTRVRRAFDAYVSAYDPENPRIALKVSHTYRVAELSEDIARSEGLSGTDIDLAWLCGMLHDVGRFEQVRRYDTFVDSRSTSHAKLGAAVLFEREAGPEGDIRNYVDPSDEDATIRAAVALHSSLELPEDLDPHTRQICEIVRDADKIDILRVNHDSPAEDIYPFGEDELRASALSPEVVATFYDHRTVPFAIRHHPADMLVGHICFVWGLIYPRSVEIMVRQGYFLDLLEHPFSNKETAATFALMERHLLNWLAERR